MSDINTLIAEWKSGGATSSAGSGNDGTVVRADESSSSSNDDGREVMSENSVVDSLLGDGEDTQKDQPAQADPKAEGKQVASEKEVITVTDESGKKRKIEIDYSNKEAIKKAHAEAAGMRKFQAERDQILRTKKEVETKLQQRESDWNALESAFQKGPEELFDLLTGRKGAFNEHVQKQAERADFLKNASPQELREFEAREKAEKQARDLDQIRKENEKFRKEIQEERESAELKSLESRVNPAFNKFAFTDKLGNADAENTFNEMLWNTALKRLEPYEAQGLDLTPELIESKFREVATTLRSQISNQASKRVGKVVEQKKREATENVQAKVMSGYKQGGATQEARDLIQKGDLTGLLKGWGKYGSVFGRK